MDWSQSGCGEGHHVPGKRPQFRQQRLRTAPSMQRHPATPTIALVYRTVMVLSIFPTGVTQVSSAAGSHPADPAGPACPAGGGVVEAERRGRCEGGRSPGGPRAAPGAGNPAAAWRTVAASVLRGGRHAAQIERIAHHRVAAARQVHADLMRPPGREPALQQRRPRCRRRAGCGSGSAPPCRRAPRPPCACGRAGRGRSRPRSRRSAARGRPQASAR